MAASFSQPVLEAFDLARQGVPRCDWEVFLLTLGDDDQEKDDMVLQEMCVEDTIRAALAAAGRPTGEPQLSCPPHPGRPPRPVGPP
jgi:hypothetical protein